MVAAGGTGGHLFPARALAEEMTRRGYAVDLVTEQRGERYGDGFPATEVHYVPSATLSSRSPIGLARTALTLLRGTIAARGIMRRRQPSAIVGFGGYPTMPPLVAAKLSGVPIAIHEQNAVMGRANRALARLAARIALSYDETRLLPGSASARASMTGAPVRDAVIALTRAKYENPGAKGAIKLLVFGGSQGARFFSDCVPDALSRLPKAMRARLSVVQQARTEDEARVAKAYKKNGVKAEVASFFKNLPQRMADAHLIISRSGASTVAELTVIGRPAILVPLPHALDNDQQENATRLAKAGGAKCCSQADLTPQSLADEIQDWLEDPNGLQAAARNAATIGRPDAVSRLADLVEDMIGSGRGKET